MSILDFTSEMNRLGQQNVPFLFIVDFEMLKPVIVRLSDIDSDLILFDVNGTTNAEKRPAVQAPVALEKFPLPKEDYFKKFQRVLHHLESGNSYLTNLTTKTEVKIGHALKDLFYMSQAKYKLFYDNQFLVFSPEIFVQVKEGEIFCFPMKGTIDASVPDALTKILHDQKEISEHVTITDLIRNDLSQVASQVRVSRFRYVEEIKTNAKTLLQVSSEIVGRLEPDFSSHLGDILVTLLPAGSVSGAPKAKTVEIIKDIEGENRGYYTGVFGVFDGKRLDSGVMIRYIEKWRDRYYYRSGGGITTQSTAALEYQEAIDKVYVPVN